MTAKRVKRMLAFLMAGIITFTSAVPMQQNSVQVQAASVYENENMLVNPNFDGSEEFSPAGGSHRGNWFSWQGPTKTQEEYRSGTTSAKLEETGASLEQDVAGLVEGMTYEFKVWAKLSGSGNGSHYIGVKNYGGEEIKQKVNSTEWKEYTLEFTYSGSADARVYCWIENAGGVTCYLDDASLTAKGDIQRVSVSNGQVQVTFAEDYVGNISKEQFSAYYKSSVEPEVAHTVEFTAGSVDGKTLTLSYDAVEAVPILQTITFNLTYASGGQTGGRSFVLDYTVEASGEECVDADIAKVTAVNGEINVLLTQNPTIKPIAQDFVWQYKIGDGEFEDLNIDEFSYVAETRTVIVKFAQLHGILEQDSVVTVKVTYGENTTSAEFALPASQSRTFYVSAEGNDNNAGTSEDAPIQSIDKLNTMTFYPGDQILFRKGDTFVGCFKPMGSGNEEHPIIIGAYGEGNKPVLRPGEDFKVPYLMSANALVQNPTVNYVIWFYNVEYWEVSDLELEDPKHEQTYLNPGDVYRSGITIQAEDAGTLEHIYVDHMEIHGFHGPHTNIGKSSGGITMNVITDLDLTSGGRQKGENSVPTQINDIRITNCEIYNVGRSGINFLTPWSFREGEKWGPFDYGTRGFDYLPYEDFYMGNNYIHDIDGDGTIIDNCADAVSEYNLVTRCVLNTNGAAVGMFNWNSDRTTFQYNEVFDIRYGTNDSNHLNDSQGIEIDALNDGTLVQYNYVHDNTGGFMMLCNIGDQYRSFDGIIRYNISQNDYAHPRQGLFDIYEANWGTEVYNNNFYLTERALSTSGYGSHVNAGELFLFSAVGARDTMKFYNNIFYYAGETPATVNTFGDDAIDWQSNIFYNFANMPTDDNAKAPNLAVDPMWNNPGAGATGTYADGKENLGYQTDLSCYYLKEGSPALNAGVQVEDNGGKDYFGNPVEGLVDIGAYESGSIALKVLSDKYAIDQSAKNLTVNGMETTVAQLLSKLISEKDVVLSVKREDVTLSDDTIVEDGDTLVVLHGEEDASYNIIVREEVIVTTENLNHVRAAKMSVSSVEVAQFGADNANDGDTSTRWSSRSVTANTNAQEWIKAEFEELTQIKHVKIKFHTRNVDPSPNNVSDFTIKYVDRDGVEQIAKANCTVPASGSSYATEVSIVLDNAIVAKAIKICDLNVKIGSTQYNSVGITELEAYSNEILPGAIVSLSGLVESLEGIQNAVIENGTFTLPEVPERFTIKLNGADFEQILGKDLTVVQPLTDKEIKVSYEVSDGTEMKVTNDITYLVKGKNTQTEGKNAKPVVIPEIQEWYSDSTEKLSAKLLTKVNYNDDSLSAVVDEFIADYKDFTGVALTKVKGEAQSGAFNFTKAAPDALLGEEGYTMHILSDRINVASESITGNMYGMQTILQMSKKDATGFAIGQMRDYPRFEVRGFMLDIARKPIAMEIINEIARTMRYYKMNDFQLHLSDNYIWLENYGCRENENEAFNAYEAFRLESDVTNAKGESPTAKDYFITKDEMRSFIQGQRALGMNIVPEIDLPAHATSFTKIWPELMVQGEVAGSSGDKSRRPLVDHFDITKPAAVEQIKAIFDDYTTGENPTFDSETVVHVGADEFEYNKTSYREFFNTIVPHVKQTNPQVRIWGSLSTINDGKTQIIPEAIENVAMNIWNNGWANGAEMYKLGFKLINTLDGPNYMVPNGGMGRGAYGDLLNHNDVFNFEPNVYGNQALPTSDDQILGSVYAIWNDNIDKNASGLTESDLYWRFFDSLPLYAEKNWAATGREKGSAEAVIALAQTFGTGPRTNPYYQEETDANGVYESYDFTNGLEDASLNDRDLRIGTAKVENGALTLKGGNSYVTTPIDKLGNGNELSFDITLTKMPAPGDILFETTPEYGTHDIRIMENGKLGFTRELYNYYFDYELPVGKTVNIKIVTEQQDTSLYVNDVLVGEAVGKFIHNGMEKKTGITHSTFALPLERIGSKTNAIAAVIDNVVVKEKEEVQEVDLYNKAGWTGSTNSETIYDANEGKLIYAFDGIPGTIWHSNWQGATDKLTDGRTYYAEIDFGQTYVINQFSFTPRTPQDSGRVTKADLYIKENASDNWKLVGEDVTFAADMTKKTFYFDEQAVRYAKFVAKESSDGWVAISEFDIANIPEQKLTVYLEATEGGSVTGAEEVKKGTSVTVTATANAGYRFDGWYDVSGAKVSETEEYTFIAQKNTALVARFALVNMGPNGVGAELLGYTLSLEGNIGVNFYLKLSDEVLNDAGAYMNFTLNGNEYAKVYVKDAEPENVNNTDCYVFKCNVPVKDMDTEIKAQIILSNGSKGAEHIYTIEKYADYIRDNAGDYSAETIELVEAMSRFGDYTTAYFAGETKDTTPVLTEEDLEIIAGNEGKIEGDNSEDSIYYGSSLLLKSDTILRHYFTEAVEGSIQKGDLYYIESKGIPAHELGKELVMEVGGMEITYNPLSYAYITLSRNDVDENLKSVIRAMYLYYEAAQEYLNAAENN